MERETTVKEAVLNKYREEKVNAVNFRLYAVNSMGDDSLEGYYTRLTMFDFGYGTIIPEIYGEAIKGSKSEEEILEIEIRELEWMKSEFEEVEKEMPLVMITASSRLFLGERSKETEGLINGLDYELREKICILFDSSILSEESKKVETLIDRLKEKGIRTGISNFGGKESTPMKLKGKGFEYVIFSPEFTLNADKEEAEEQLLIEMISRLGYKCVVGNRYNESYNDVNHSEYSEETYYISGTGETVAELINGEITGDILKGIPYSIIEKYGLEDKSEDEIIEIVSKIEIEEIEKATEEKKGEAEKETYDRSFIARIKQSKEEVKGYYVELKLILEGYKKIHSRLSWKYESYNKGREKIAKLVIRGKTLCIYLNLRDKEIDTEKYKIEKTYGRMYIDTPYKCKITSKRKLSRIKELIEMLLDGEERMERVTESEIKGAIKSESTKNLIKKGLIKKKTEKARLISEES